MVARTRYFAGTRTLSDISLVDIDGQVLVEAYEHLRNVIDQRCGASIAALFAEPILSRGNGEAAARVDWYSQYEGPVRLLHELDPGTRGLVERRLSERLSALRALLTDPRDGLFVGAALNILGPSSIVAVGDEPLLLDWGMLPVDVRPGPRQERHFAATLGPFLPGVAAPALTRQEWQSRLEPAAAGDAARNPATPEPLPTVVGVAAPAAASGWRAPAIASGLAALTLALSYIPGVLRFPTTVPSDAAIAAARAGERDLIRSLEQRRAALVAALGQPCSALAGRDASILAPPPVARTIVGPPGALPAPERPSVASGTPGAAPAPGADGSAAPETPPPPLLPASGQPSAPMMLPDRLAKGVALVIADGGTGTGFFISNTFLVSNRHVVTTDRKVLIASAATGVVEGEVVRTGGEGQLTDFALIRVPAQSGVLPFALSTSPRQSEAVSAAGFPGVYMKTDPAFLKLMQGDRSAAAGLTPVLTEGKVYHLQRRDEGITLVLHGAEIAPGNSGGPLVDGCGRVLGVNTFGRTDDKVPVTARYALGSDGLLRFLRDAGQTVSPATDPCQPRVAAPPAEAAAPPAPGAAAPATGTPALPAASATASPAPVTSGPASAAPAPGSPSAGPAAPVPRPSAAPAGVPR